MDKNDKPRVLPLDSSSEANFKELVDKYSGGATYRSIMDELVAAKAIIVDSNKNVELIKPFYLTDNDPNDLQKIDLLALSSQFLLETIEYNINPITSKPRFQRIIMQDKLPKSLSLIAESYIRMKSQDLANDVDEYLEHLVHHSDLEENPEILPNIGLGIYFFKNDNTNN